MLSRVPVGQPHGGGRNPALKTSLIGPLDVQDRHADGPAGRMVASEDLELAALGVSGDEAVTTRASPMIQFDGVILWPDVSASPQYQEAHSSSRSGGRGRLVCLPPHSLLDFGGVSPVGSPIKDVEGRPGWRSATADPLTRYDLLPRPLRTTRSRARSRPSRDLLPGPVTSAHDGAAAPAAS
jgi:hypothetical protein